MKPITFNVGPWPFRLYLVADLRDEDGKRLMGQCDPTSLEIRIDADLPPERRLETLSHELAHAWQFATGIYGSGDETSADLFATATVAMVLDFDRQREALAAAGFSLWPGAWPQCPPGVNGRPAFTGLRLTAVG